MKIQWFTPFPPERTDVGNFSVRVCQKLAQYCELTVWVSPEHFRWIRRFRRSFEFKMLSYDAIDDYRQELNRADALFYNLGNNAAFHREIIRILRQFPGVAIMHDLSLFECVSSIYRERLGGDRMFLDLVRHLYGVRSEGIVEDWLLAGDEARRKIDAASECPFAGHATLGAWGLVTHTEIPQGHELHHDLSHQWT